MHNQIFTVEEEESISDFIRNNVLANGYVFTDGYFKAIAIQAYLEKHKDDDNFKEFNCSAHFINDFKNRNGFSSRRAHYKRRNPKSLNEEKNFVEMIKDLIYSSNSRTTVILNVDETRWTIFPNGVLTWAEKGSDNVTVNINDDEKDGITAIATIGTNGHKFPLFLIAKGKTQRCEQNQIGDCYPHIAKHSMSGWTTQEIFNDYLKFVRSQYRNEITIHLILDLFSVHRSNETTDLASKLNIQLHFIPGGMTDKLQPLDRRIFGCMKATAKNEVLKKLITEPNAKIGIQGAVKILIYAWEHISRDAIEDAWENFYEED